MDREKKEVRKENRKKGFTLVELLIVVAIIGILAAVAIPQYAKYKKKAAIAAAEGAISSCMSELVAAYADNSSATSLTCDVGEGSCNLEVDEDTGAVTISGTCNPTVKGISVTCGISNNRVSCS